MTHAARQAVTSLYIHVPFCGRKCAYCDFYSLADAGPQWVDAWHSGILVELERLAAEAGGAGFRTAPLQTIYLGGGTPSSLEASLVASILDRTRQLFSRSPDCELTIEANPESLRGSQGRDLLLAWSEAGINRISLGLQAASDRLLRQIGRSHRVQDAVQAVNMAWEEGFRRLSLDMMTGLPDQTLKDVRETLDLILSLPVDHVSSYALTLASGTPLHALMERSPGRFPDDDLERRMTHEVKARLEASGFEHYEISNFARPGARSRHNSVYWQADPYLAAGPAAASYLGGVRRCNPASLEDWLRLVEDPGQGPLGLRTLEEAVDEEAARVETMILGLRLLEGVTFQRFRERHQVSMDACFGPALARLEEEGLIQRDPAGVRLSSKGLDFADKVWRALL